MPAAQPDRCPLPCCHTSELPGQVGQTCEPTLNSFADAIVQTALARAVLLKAVAFCIYNNLLGPSLYKGRAHTTAVLQEHVAQVQPTPAASAATVVSCFVCSKQYIISMR